MYYLIDGYNLIFSLIDSKKNLRILRQEIIHSLQTEFSKKHISGTLVFDGAHRRDEESGLSYPSPLIVAYTPKGQSADDYILEMIACSKSPKQLTVVTNDRGLSMHAKSQKAHVLNNDTFIHWLSKKKVKKKKIEPVETKQNIERLLKIFEERLKNEDEEL